MNSLVLRIYRNWLGIWMCWPAEVTKLGAQSWRDLFGYFHDRTRPPRMLALESCRMVGSAVEEKRRILIVDDDRDSTHVIKILLEKVGPYRVLEESDATKAYQSARSFRPDLIFLDVVMPEADGGDVAAKIEADPTLRRTPIIFLTALVTKAEAKAGLHMQGHPILAKPISIPELINKIEENLPAHAA